MYICPICSEKLHKENKSYYCINRHCYDIAKEGYINLLPVQKKNSLNPGDNKEMIMARHKYLNQGAYDTLVDRIAELILDTVDSDNIDILDAGCGEGYYIERIKKYITTKSSRIVNLYGLDISKDAVKIGAKSYKDIDFAVGSVYSMPYQNDSFSVILNVFAPFDNKESVRLLKKGGIAIKVVPSKNHLQEFRKIIYDTYTEHEEKLIDSTNFTFIKKVNVKYEKEFNDNETITSLFKMTPYYFNATEDATSKIMALESISLTIDFDIYMYRVDK